MKATYIQLKITIEIIEKTKEIKSKIRTSQRNEN